jgi:serine protease Do
MPSIVSINSTVTSTYNSYFGSYNKDETGSGSGIILKISDDEILIVTNNHVIADAKKNHGRF